EIARQLNARLAPKYVALTTQRVVLAARGEDENRADRWPDVGVVSGSAPSGNSGAATAVAPLVVNAVETEEVPQYGVEIVDASGRLRSALPYRTSPFHSMPVIPTRDWSCSGHSTRCTRTCATTCRSITPSRRRGR